ncbi:hypothetical protein [Sphingomonas sp. KC8]|uniref:hypothetical protein n=1 Tax=Sphingomonas sp. KC8 TaxID=1030157 RepID=UPI000248AB48|nr:hypothetical protein [Sphingomonas sp. KC8]ARS26839.1 hypothetical protein KC8_06005 [Sphingomonas sp. KC8]
MSANPLHTADQRAAETLALRLIERADVRAARERARRVLLADAVAATLDGRILLDRALDQWVLALAMREANGDVADPRVVWNVSNAPRPWFDHVYPGAAVAIDNPDNFNREIPIAGEGRYEIAIRFSEDPPQFSIVIEMEPDHHAGLGRNIGAFTLQDLLAGADADRRVIVTVGPDDNGAGPFHFRTEPGRIQIYTRDSQADWSQVPAEVSVRRLDPPTGWQPRSEDEIATTVIADMPAWVQFWAGFKDDFLGYPEPNRLVGPNGRDGGWGYLAGGRFRLAGNEALVLTLDPAGSYYTGFQVSDPWTISPDPMHRTVSLNKAQTALNPDGTATFVLSPVDPGIANWIDTVSLAEGWMMVRWQGVPAGADPATFIRDVRLVAADALDQVLAAGAPRIEIAGRRRQIAERARLHAARTCDAAWARRED